MKKWFALALVLVVLSVSFSAIAEPFSIRNGVTFGMTREEIIACEGAEPHEENATMLLYTKQKSAGKDCSILYTLTDGLLTNIAVSFKEEHSFENGYIEDFLDVSQSLKTKYGEPYLDEACNWKNTLYKDDPESFGFAVSIGHLTVCSSWVFDDFEIAHLLVGDNYEINHGILYKHVSYETQVDTDGI